MEEFGRVDEERRDIRCNFACTSEIQFPRQKLPWKVPINGFLSALLPWIGENETERGRERGWRKWESYTAREREKKKNRDWQEMQEPLKRFLENIQWNWELPWRFKPPWKRLCLGRRVIKESEEHDRPGNPSLRIWRGAGVSASPQKGESIGGYRQLYESSKRSLNISQRSQLNKLR